MTNSTHKETADQEARELLEHRDEAGEWSEEAETIDVRPSRSEVVSFRMPVEELDALEEAATKRGESLSEFIRGALTRRLHGEPIGPLVEISSGAMSLTIRSVISDGGRKVAPASFVPDVPPLTAASV